MIIPENKFSIGYFVKRQADLLEMARPDKGLAALGETGKLYKKIFDDMGKIMSSGKYNGEQIINSEGNPVPGLPVKDRQLKYAFMVLYDHAYPESEDDWESNTGDSQRFNNKITGLVKKVLTDKEEQDKTSYFALLKDPDKRIRKAILLLLRDNPEYIATPDFKEAMLNPTKIADFIEMKYIEDSEYSRRRAAEKEEFFGMDYRDILMAKTEGKDLVQKINREMRSRSRRKTQPSTPEAPTDITNSFTDNVDTILSSIEGLQALKTVFDRLVETADPSDTSSYVDSFERLKMFTTKLLNRTFTPEEYAAFLTMDRDKTGNTLLDDLYEQFSEFKSTGISLENFEKEIEDLKSYIPENMIPILDLIYNDVMTDENIEDTDSEFPGYDQDILDKYLITPQDRKVFSNWYNWYKIELERRIEKLDADKERITYTSNSITPAELELLRAYVANMEKGKTDKDWVLELQRDKEEKAAQSAKEYPTEPVYNPFDDMSEDEESPVMGYMTEQIKKDKFKPVGEFKDRGFKKVRNYNEWLIRNQ